MTDRIKNMEEHYIQLTKGKKGLHFELHEFCSEHKTTQRKLSILMAEEEGKSWASINSELSRGNFSPERMELLKKVLTKVCEGEIVG